MDDTVQVYLDIKFLLMVKDRKSRVHNKNLYVFVYAV